MSSNPSSQAEEKSFPGEDSAGVPIVAVTAELPVDAADDAAELRVVDTPGPGTEPIALAAGGAERGEPDAERALADAGLDASPSDASLEDRTEDLLDDSSDDSRQASSESLQQALHEATSSADEVAAAQQDGSMTPGPLLSPNVLTSAVLPLPAARNDAEGASAQPRDELDPEESSSLDASDLVIEGDLDEADTKVRRRDRDLLSPPPFLESNSGPPLGSADEEFLRRVVLPPIPAHARTTLAGMPVIGRPFGEETDDHTVISSPPSAELLASMTPPRAPHAAPLPSPHAGPPPRRGGVHLGWGQLLLLLGVAAGAGSVGTGYLRPESPAPLSAGFVTPAPAIAPERAPATPPAAAQVPPAPTVASEPAAPSEAPAPKTLPPPAVPPVAAKAVVATPPVAARPAARTAPPAAPAPAPAAPAVARTNAESKGVAAPAGRPPEAEPARPARAGKAVKRTARRAKRPPAKKPFVDPFE